MRTFNGHICKKELNYREAISKDALKGTKTALDEFFCLKCSAKDRYRRSYRKYISRRFSHKSSNGGGKL
jgi:hypothetical protein